MSSPTPPRKRGGPQPGSGRPEKPPEEKFRRAQITMTPEQYKATAKDRSGMVRRALDKHLASISEERIERAAKMQRAAIPELHEFLRVRREIISRGGSLDQIENVNDWIRTLLAV